MIISICIQDILTKFAIFTAMNCKIHNSHPQSIDAKYPFLFVKFLYNCKRRSCDFSHWLLQISVCDRFMRLKIFFHDPLQIFSNLSTNWQNIFFCQRLMVFTVYFRYHLTKFAILFHDRLRKFVIFFSVATWPYERSFIWILNFLLDYLTKIASFCTRPFDEICNFYLLVVKLN